MHVYIKQGTYFLINVLLCTILFFIFSESITLVGFIDTIFYIGLLYFCIGLLWLVIRGQFFDVMVFSFRRVTSKMSKSKAWMERFEEKKLPSELTEKKTMQFFLIQGLLLLLLMLLLFIIYYS
ncbi:DUF3899 domain-containing protein [Saliterribacillus persicus]|uniref:Uncharacterized protein DUF3899 n=1 Tax=Saliterribacillus persicus TaxID=930114 RepID=A0A368XNZ1_9BACI|nr:DUF3899 domain-containing protein [Saliterribacillus persicus]RCW69732.1 uncharacterized protein DUF3899 [Saliterribacillus persicus]